MRLIKLSALFGTALLLLGCFPPTTTHPVGTTAGLANDPTLTGLWRGKMESSDAGRDVYFHFLPTADGTITVVLVQAGAEPDGDWSVASITTAALGPNHFMNGRMVMSNGKPEDDNETTRGTIPLLYRADGQGRLVLFLLDEDAVKAAIKAHQIAGVVEEGQFGDAKITADPKALDAFMASRKGIALYGERFATLTKIE